MKLNPFASDRQGVQDEIAMDNKAGYSGELAEMRFDAKYRIKYFGCVALVVFNMVCAS